MCHGIHIVFQGLQRIPWYIWLAFCVRVGVYLFIAQGVLMAVKMNSVLNHVPP